MSGTRARTSAACLVALLVTSASQRALAEEPAPSELAPLPPAGAPAPSTTDTGVPASVGVAPSTATDAPARPAQKDPANEMRIALRGAGGFQYAKVHGVPITGARLRLGAGGQTDFGGHYAVLSILYGSTESDLRAWDVRVGWIGDFLRFSIFRLGLDAEVGYLVIRRASVDDRLWALGAGAGVHVSADVFSFGPRGDHAITVEGRFDGHLHFGPAFVWGPSVLAGFRY